MEFFFYRQLTHFIVDLHRHTWRETVVLIAGRLQQTETQLHLNGMLHLGTIPYITIRGNLGGLLWCECEIEGYLLHALSIAWYQGRGFNESAQDLVESQFLQSYIRMYRQLCGNGVHERH